MGTPEHAAGSILLIEDNRNLAELVGEYLEQHGYVVDYASNGADGLNLAIEHRYDAIVLDLILPRLDGFEVCRRLRVEAKVATPVLMLSARGALDDKLRGLESGGDDYLVKPFALQELEARIRALIRRDRRQVGGELLRVGDLSLDTTTLRVSRGDAELHLSPIALKLLTILMRESPRVVSRRAIEREIWGDTLPDSDTLRSHLYNLRQVIDKPFQRPLLHTIHGAGYRLADLDELPARRRA